MAYLERRREKILREHGFDKNTIEQIRTDDKTRWLVDEDAATVVRRIFSLCMQGKGISAIAECLGESG